MTAKKYIGTFKSRVAKDLRKLFNEGAVQASFIRRFRGKEELFAVFSGDERAQIILRDYAERRYSKKSNRKSIQKEFTKGELP